MKKKFNLGGMMQSVQGVLGNLTEQSIDDMKAEYGQYIMADEEIQSGFKLVRDVIIFTDIRILFVDKQGATGKKTSFKSIYLMNIVDAEMETAGFGIDDSEITITYLVNVRRKARNEEFATVKFEFPKSTDIVPLYKMLLELGYKNRLEINEEEQ